MGFPFDEATWDAVTGAMYMGAGGSAPFIFTLLSAVACVVALWLGNSAEHNHYKNHDK